MSEDHEVILSTDSAIVTPNPAIPDGIYLIRTSRALETSKFAYLQCKFDDDGDEDEDDDGEPDDNKGLVKTARKTNEVNHELLVCCCSFSSLVDQYLCLSDQTRLQWKITYDAEERDYDIVNLEHKLKLNRRVRGGRASLVAGTIKTHWLIIPDGSTFMLALSLH